MRLIELLAKKDTEWRAMAEYITKDKELGDDLVQEFYLKMDKKDGKIKLNHNYDDYIFIILKNLNYDLNIRTKNTINGERKQINLDDEYICDSINYKIEKDNIEANSELYKKECFDEFYKNIEYFIKEGYSKLNKTKQYKVGLLELNALQGLSMAKISEKTGITKRSIQLSIESVRRQIKKEYQNEYDNYKIKLKNE
jgi:DNA-directed RNA polymerase specialized sigma24 family protein